MDEGGELVGEWVDLGEKGDVENWGGIGGDLGRVGGVRIVDNF